MEESVFLIEWLAHYKYLVILPLTLLQAPTMMMAGGFLLRLGYFTFLPLYIALMVADLVGDMIWYAIGYHAAHPLVRRYGYFLGITEGILGRMERLFKTHPAKILFLSKITMGFGPALLTLTAAGASQVDFKKYVIINALGGFIWTAMLMSIGYFFGELYNIVDEGFRAIFAVFFWTVVVAALYGFSRYLRQRFMKGKLEL